MDELNKLENWLKDNGYHYIRKSKFSGGIVVVNDLNGNYLWDAVCHEFSYGNEKGLLEVMGEALLDHDDVEGWLTCEDIVQKIKEQTLWLRILCRQKPSNFCSPYNAAHTNHISCREVQLCHRRLKR